jgi:hypothetical protein
MANPLPVSRLLVTISSTPLTHDTSRLETLQPAVQQHHQYASNMHGTGIDQQTLHQALA